MANFIGLVYATLKKEGIDTSNMSTDEAVKKFKELQGSGEKESPEDVKKKLNGEKKEGKEEQKPEDVKKKLGGESPKEDNKQKQFEIIQKYNPMKDDYHVGIRNENDIKTWKEAMEDEESFYWGDFDREDAEKALEKGTITVYSSYPIKQGTFVSTSKNQAKDYAGGKEIYSMEVSLDKVAWINGDEGQFADVDAK